MKNRSINVKEASFPEFNTGEQKSSDVVIDYTGLLMNVPLDVRVEIGRTKMIMSDVLSLGQGSIIRLEKQAGAPVDIIANDRTVARGDVIVIDENFGVRITEIISDRKYLKGDKKENKDKTSDENTSEGETAPTDGTETDTENK